MDGLQSKPFRAKALCKKLAETCIVIDDKYALQVAQYRALLSESMLEQSGTHRKGLYKTLPSLTNLNRACPLTVLESE